MARKGRVMEQIAILGLMYVAVGAGLYALPAPGTAEPADFAWRRQAEIFWATLPAVFGWPVILWRRWGC